MMRALAGAIAFGCSVAAHATTLDAVIYTKHGEVPLTLEIAATPPQRERGLMERETIGPNDGMIFLFPQPQPLAFWMKHTRIPLDMIFIDEHCRIVTIHANVPPESLDQRRSHGAAMAVIELDGGRAARDSIHVGDHVRYELPPSLEIE